MKISHHYQQHTHTNGARSLMLLRRRRGVFFFFFYFLITFCCPHHLLFPWLFSAFPTRRRETHTAALKLYRFDCRHYLEMRGTTTNQPPMRVSCLSFLFHIVLFKKTCSFFLITDDDEDIVVSRSNESLENFAIGKRTSKNTPGNEF
jgi:hypothetical protein